MFISTRDLMRRLASVADHESRAPRLTHGETAKTERIIGASPKPPAQPE